MSLKIWNNISVSFEEAKNFKVWNGSSWVDAIQASVWNNADNEWVNFFSIIPFPLDWNNIFVIGSYNVMAFGNTNVQTISNIASTITLKLDASNMSIAGFADNALQGDAVVTPYVNGNPQNSIYFTIFSSPTANVTFSVTGGTNVYFDVSFSATDTLGGNADGTFYGDFAVVNLNNNTTLDTFSISINSTSGP